MKQDFTGNKHMRESEQNMRSCTYSEWMEHDPDPGVQKPRFQPFTIKLNNCDLRKKKLKQQRSSLINVARKSRSWSWRWGIVLSLDLQREQKHLDPENCNQPGSFDSAKFNTSTFLCSQGKSGKSQNHKDLHCDTRKSTLVKMDKWCISEAATNYYFCSFFIIIEKNSQKFDHAWRRHYGANFKVHVCRKLWLKELNMCLKPQRTFRSLFGS